MRYRILAFVLTTLVISAEATNAAEPWLLFYDKPAAKWNEALPIGNGRLGAMVFGGVSEERIQFNEDTLWTGRPHEYQRQGAVEFLPQIRRLLSEGKKGEAEKLAMQKFMSDPLRQKAYQPFGDILISFPYQDSAVSYVRDLNLDTATANVRYQVGNVKYVRRSFVSHPDQVIVWHIEADKQNRIEFTVKPVSPHKSAQVTKTSNKELALKGHVADGGMRFDARIRVFSDGGTVKATDNEIQVTGATSALLLVSAATSFRDYTDADADPAIESTKILNDAASKDFATLWETNKQDHQSLFHRVQLDLGSSEASKLPTNQRLKLVSKQPDPNLEALYFQFGRYLLITSSRPGAQPANLQGIWNDQMKPPWDSKWTVNIYTEMNYWPTETCNLSVCHEPLFDMIEECVESGRKTAQTHYGCRGWVLHHNTDLWRGTAPINHSNHGIWVSGGAWLCQHLWERYLFTGDKQFLSERAYPAMKGASQFFEDFLIRDPESNWLISGPSNSPEIGGLVMGPTMDHQIIRALFRNTAAAAKELGVDDEFADGLLKLVPQIAPNQIGKHGQLQEWLEDKDDPRNQHRHVSHLWGLHPGCEITPRETPKLAAAAKQSLEYRGDGGTGWSKAWKINFWARLLDGDHAHKMLVEALAGNTFPNLFDAHPPFQIDGNFGGTAGVAEMLLQSHTEEIELLPALPSAWPKGFIEGLRARGGFTIDLAWADGQLTEATIHSDLGKPARLRYGNAVRTIEIAKGQTVTWDGK